MEPTMPYSKYIETEPIDVDISLTIDFDNIGDFEEYYQLIAEGIRRLQEYYDYDNMQNNGHM